MIRSMTGYGEATGTTAAGPLRIELRTVNHRHFNLNARLPTALVRLESELREWLRAYFPRGHVNCTVQWERNGDVGSAPRYRLDDERVTEYLALFDELTARFGIKGEPDLALLTRFNDVIVRADEGEAAPELDSGEVRAIVMTAAEQVVAMREEEGKRLEVDLRQRIDSMERSLAEIDKLAPERIVAERRRMTEAVAELIGEDRLDEDRIAQEIAILAERWDLNEELVRFRSHNELFIALLDGRPDEPVGKRLSFLVQEMHREANTIGSKANDSAIAHLVVSIKDQLERLREQVENVE